MHCEQDRSSTLSRTPEPPAQTQENEEPSEAEFEEFVAAALKVDPKGMSGKHRRKESEDAGSPTAPSN